MVRLRPRLSIRSAPWILYLQSTMVRLRPAAQAAEADWAAWVAGVADVERKWQINHVIEVLDGLEEEAEQ